MASCKTNLTINWIIYTDQAYQSDILNNVQFIHCTFSAYKALVSEKLGIKFNPSNPYKLCDIKPTLGFVHQGDIAHYDYWGFRVRKFLRYLNCVKKGAYILNYKKVVDYVP